KETYSQEWHDRYVSAVYKIAEEKKNEKNIEKVEEIKEEIKKTKTKKK
ncbi:hypothetical protein HZR15_18325, partial [Clostridium botulinum]|nr:hypothetical protein [Clostridium botulinum]